MSLDERVAEEFTTCIQQVYYLSNSRTFPNLTPYNRPCFVCINLPHLILRFRLASLPTPSVSEA